MSSELQLQIETRIRGRRTIRRARPVLAHPKLSRGLNSYLIDYIFESKGDQYLEEKLISPMLRCFRLHKLTARVVVPAAWSSRITSNTPIPCLIELIDDVKHADAYPCMETSVVKSSKLSPVAEVG